ncbi:MAG: glycine cleavage system protein GcvH [Acidimicrobiia bacterium]|nr:glycine cleavage system protein GcvH [Acidimicrobiia bacterium]
MTTDSDTPGDLLYTASHEWLRRDPASPGEAVIGITDFAQDQLGDVVYLDLVATGTQVGAGEACGEIESTKTVAELYAPVDCEIIAVNGELEDAPELVNESPYGEGWLIRVRIAEDAELAGLLDAAGYRAEIEAN